jgi:hypothetical protein
VRFLVQGVVLMALRPELILAQVSQESLNDRTPKVSASSGTFIGRLTGPYAAPGPPDWSARSSTSRTPARSSA